MTPGTTNSTPATSPPAVLHEPTNIDGKLLRLWTRQKVAIVQRVQEPAFRDPAPFLDDDPVHDGDLSGRPAETEQRHAQPDLEGLSETHAVRRHGLARQYLDRRFCGRAHDRPLAGVGQLCVSSTASRAQR